MYGIVLLVNSSIFNGHVSTLLGRASYEEDGASSNEERRYNSQAHQHPGGTEERTVLHTWDTGRARDKRTEVREEDSQVLVYWAY